MSKRNILFGYKVLGGKYEIIPSEAEIVKEAFERYIAGEAFKQIADSFLERGITYYRDNRTWNKNMISRMVGDKRYLGDTQYPLIITSKAFGLSENMRQGKSAKKTELPEITELIKSKLICGFCGQKIRRINKWRTREKWLCTAGCKCEVYLDDKYLFEDIGKALKKLTDNPEAETTADYQPTPDITRQTNDIYRMMEQSQVDFKEIANQILNCASDKYDCCHIKRNGELSKALLPEYVPLLNQDSLNPEMIRRAIEKIYVFPDGSIKLHLFSGEEITYKTEEKESNAGKDSNED